MFPGLDVFEWSINCTPCFLLPCRAFSALVNTHLPVVQSNAWHLAVPTLRLAFAGALDALFTTQCRNVELLCTAAAIVGTSAEVAGQFAMLAVSMGHLGVLILQAFNS